MLNYILRKKKIPVSVRKRLDNPSYTNWYRLVDKVKRR